MKADALSLSAPGSQLCAGLLQQGLRVRVRVSGASMAPVLEQGDVVQLQPAACVRLRLGDIVFIQDPRRGFYLHRLLRRPCRSGQSWFQTRGDAQRRLDDPVARRQVLARVAAIEHRPGKPHRWRLLARAGPALALFALAQSAWYYRSRK